MDALIARKTWRTVEPWHAAVYFASEAEEEFTPLVSAASGASGTSTSSGASGASGTSTSSGASGASGTSTSSGASGASGTPTALYFASRSAPMGAVASDVVVATFFNFEPGFVRSSMDGAWDRAAPAEWLAARERVADRMIRRLAPDAVASPDVAEAAELLRRVADVACTRPEGRPLFAAHAELPWPEEPHRVVWHAQTLLREFRGDGHIAALTAEGLSGCEALVTHAASGEITADSLRASRRWSREAWAAAEDQLRARGWIDANGTFTDEGRQRRARIEERTDELSVAPYAVIGEQRCALVRELLRPFSRQLASVFG